MVRSAYGRDAPTVGNDSRVECQVRQVAGGVRAAPSDAELARTIESVPGVASARVERHDDGRSRLRLRLHPDEDAEAVSWSVAATLRERFAIALDPTAIRPIGAPATESSADRADAGFAATRDAQLAADPGSPPGEQPPPPPAPSTPADAMDGSVNGAAAAGVTSPPTDDTTDGTPDDTAADTAPDAAEPGETSSPTDDTVLELGEHPKGEEADPIRVIHEASEPTERPASRDTAATASRAAIRHLEVQRGETDVRVTVRLEHDGRYGDGTRQAVLTGPGIGRAIAEATVDALRMLVGVPLLVGIDSVSVRHNADPAAATVVLTLLSNRTEDTLIGAALLDGDPDGAVMRATLDALNRRVEPLLGVDGPAS